jgi:hypothetical protein
MADSERPRQPWTAAAEHVERLDYSALRKLLDELLDDYNDRADQRLTRILLWTIFMPLIWGLISGILWLLVMGILNR